MFLHPLFLSLVFFMLFLGFVNPTRLVSYGNVSEGKSGTSDVY